MRMGGNLSRESVLAAAAKYQRILPMVALSISIHQSGPDAILCRAA
jgi:hypothetical protein